MFSHGLQAPHSQHRIRRGLVFRFHNGFGLKMLDKLGLLTAHEQDNQAKKLTKVVGSPFRIHQNKNTQTKGNMHVFRNTILYLYNQHLIEFSLVNLFTCFLAVFFLVAYRCGVHKGPKSWDEIEKEDREKATRKGLTYAAWLEARAKKKEHEPFPNLFEERCLLETIINVCVAERKKLLL